MEGVIKSKPPEDSDNGPDTKRLAWLRAQLPDTNINPTTFLATDYLNHFNEFVMMLELAADAPEMLEFAQKWEPKSYRAHFEDSAFPAKEFAIEAYELAPKSSRRIFDCTINELNNMANNALAAVGQAVDSGNHDFIAMTTQDRSREMRELMDVASAIINGKSDASSQQEIDAVFDS
jgi:hypothetical protein